MATANQILGGGDGEFNLGEIRRRAIDLRQSIAEVLNALGMAPELLQWEAVLQRYATVNLQVMALREALRGIMRKAMVFPCLVDGPAVAQALPIQLASSLLAEQQEEEAAQVAVEQQRLTGPSEHWFQAADMQVDELNRLLTDLTGPKGLLDPQGEAYRGLAKTSTSIRTTLGSRKQAPSSAQLKRPRGAYDAPPPKVEFDSALRQLLTGQAALSGKK